jgi:hypothetical protein
MAVTDLKPWKSVFSGQTAWIVGRGKTDFDYAGLAQADGPVFFINDAVQLETHVKGPSFFGYLDNRVGRTWLAKGIKSTVLTCERDEFGEHNVILWQRKSGYMYRDRDQVAANNALVTSWGTITPVLHFAWYTGCERVKFIGCDGVAQEKGKEYDERLANESQNNPGCVYGQIRASQERLCAELGLAYIYVGTPREDNRAAVRFVSFATPKYEPHMLILADSAAAFGLLTHFEAVSDKGGWQGGVAYKPEFIAAMQAEHPAERLVWLDADAEVCEYPGLFWAFADEVDFAAHWREGKELLSGTLYFGATKGAAEIVRAWVEAQREAPGVWDQKVLQHVLESSKRRWRIEKLPPQYTFIYDTFRSKYPKLQPVIEHHQASRQHRAG